MATVKTSSQQDLYIAENLKEPLLREPAIKALNLLKAVNTVKIEGHQFKKEFPELFTVLGKLEHVYQICFNAGAQKFSIDTASLFTELYKIRTYLLKSRGERV